MFENIECGPCNDGICDWMPCTFPGLCIHNCITTPPEEETMATRKAVETEAVNSEHTFEYLGDNYDIPPAKKWPLDAVEAQENGKMIAFLRSLLGDQYDVLRKKVNTIEE